MIGNCIKMQNICNYGPQTYVKRNYFEGELFDPGCDILRILPL